MIILEGADHVGKTVAAEKLAELIAARHGGFANEFYGHMSRPPDDFDHVAEYIRGVHLGVQDRYHLGSIVYGRILGGGSFCSARKMRVVQEYLRWRGCVVVIFTCERDTLRKRLEKAATRGEMYKREQILDANEAFRGLSVAANDLTPYCDKVIDVTDEWASETVLKQIFEDWWRRFMS